MAYEWVDVDFRPAPSGWRVAYVDAAKNKITHVAMAGWMLQVHTGADRNDDRERRVVPAVHGGMNGLPVGEVVAAECVAEVWAVLGPGEPDLTVRDMEG
ncbi:MAG TPA: hypothetical protein VGP57_04135 [Actinoplanes sp.]|jgi:hypothetical protein|nr:hypothetical protein [Actinoplanes sp.]